MTAPGLQRLETELRQLKSEERPSIIRQIAEARSHGDLSENAEYHAARERQSFIEGRIAELEEIVSAVEVIDPSSLSGEFVMFGAHVRLVDEETEKESTYQIVGMHEADIKIGRLSVSSPLAKALIGKTIGDTVSVPTPGGDRSYENSRGQVYLSRGGGWNSRPPECKKKRFTTKTQRRQSVDALRKAPLVASFVSSCLRGKNSLNLGGGKYRPMTTR